MIKPAIEKEMRGRRRPAWIWPAIAVMAILVGTAAYWTYVRSQSSSTPEPVGAIVLRTVSAADVTITVYGADGSPRVGRSKVIVQFRDAHGSPVDVGTLTADGTMAMPGMAMTAGLVVHRVAGRGRYELEGEYKMGGAWTFVLDWNGPHGRGRTSFDLEVQ